MTTYPAYPSMNFTARAKHAPYPSMAYVAHHPSAHCRSLTFQNMQFAREAISTLMRGECDLEARLNLQALIFAAFQKARRNHDSARCLGFRLPG